jgi:hypothetical protein
MNVLTHFEMHFRPYTSSGSGDNITDGITLLATDNPNGIIQNYQVYDNV